MIHTPPAIDLSTPAMRAWEKLPESIRAEVISNKLYVSLSPTTYHQRVCMSICRDLEDHVTQFKLGEVWSVPVDTYLEGPGKSVVVPDVIFIATDNKLKERREGLFGVPDLLIEILSRRTRKYDLTTKKDLYERNGVREYWVVDPETKEAQGYLLKEGAYGSPLVMKSKINVRILKKTFKF